MEKFKLVEEIPCLCVMKTHYPDLKFFSNARTLRCDRNFLNASSGWLGYITLNENMTKLGLDNLNEVSFYGTTGHVKGLDHFASKFKAVKIINS